MLWFKRLPPDLLERAERKSWFRHEDTARVLDWIEHEGCGLLGMDTAKKSEDNWVLLLHPMLMTALGRGEIENSLTSRQQALEEGRRFLRENCESDLMFEPVW